MSCDPQGSLLPPARIFYWDREQTMGHRAAQTPLPLLAPPAPVPLCVGTAQVPPDPPQPVPSASSQLSGTQSRGQAAPSSASGASSPPFPSPAQHSQALGPSLCALLQAGLGVWMEGGMLWGDRNPCSGKHIKRVTLYRGEEGGAGRGALLGALIRVAFAVRLPFLLCLLVVRVEPLLLFPAHAFHHHQHQDHHGQEPAHGGAHDHGHRRVVLWGLWGHRAQAQGTQWEQLRMDRALRAPPAAPGSTDL